MATGKSYRRLDNRSRMSGDVHVRFSESLGVRFPRATHLVIMARYIGSRITGWTVETLEDRFGLQINRDKTRIVRVAEPGQSLDFLGYTFRYDLDRRRRGHCYLNMCPSKKSVVKERAVLREKTGPRQCFKPVPQLIQELNRNLVGWANYYGYGYPRQAFRNVNRFVRERLVIHLKRRSQRPYKPPAGKSYYAHLAELGLVYLK